MVGEWREGGWESDGRHVQIHLQQPGRLDGAAKLLQKFHVLSREA